jgi:glycerol-3-phosphate dehydrogenase subunit C
MTTTYDPRHPKYLDEAAVRDELTRVYDICHGCRLCLDVCASFQTLFELIDRIDGHDAAGMTPFEQDQVVDDCFQCKRCYTNCPYTPELHERRIDFPRLMLRASAMQHTNGITTVRERAATQMMARTDLLGKVATSSSPIANRMIGAKPGSFVRKVVAAVVGVSSVRLLPPYANQRFSTWFQKRPTGPASERPGVALRRVTVFPTCLVEYQNTGLGKDLVQVYERNGIDCSLSAAGCCGAPWLHAGDVGHFTKVARRNVATLAAEIRRGTDVVVPQPTCSYILKTDYLDYVGGADAELVATHTYDVSEYLMTAHSSGSAELDTHFTGEIFEEITYHLPCHLRAQNIGFTSGRLMELTGAKVELVEQCSGTDGLWGLRAGNEHISLPAAVKLGELIEQAEGDIVASDCHLANIAIIEQTGRIPLHPIQVIARAYGTPPDRRTL